MFVVCCRDGCFYACVWRHRILCFVCVCYIICVLCLCDVPCVAFVFAFYLCVVFPPHPPIMLFVVCFLSGSLRFACAFTCLCAFCRVYQLC